MIHILNRVSPIFDPKLTTDKLQIMGRQSIFFEFSIALERKYTADLLLFQTNNIIPRLDVASNPNMVGDL